MAKTATYAINLPECYSFSKIKSFRVTSSSVRQLTSLLKKLTVYDLPVTLRDEKGYIFNSFYEFWEKLEKSGKRISEYRRADSDLYELWREISGDSQYQELQSKQYIGMASLIYDGDIIIIYGYGDAHVAKNEHVGKLLVNFYEKTFQTSWKQGDRLIVSKKTDWGD